MSDLQALAASIEDEAKRKDLLATIRALIAAKESGGQAATPAPLSERIVSYSAGSSSRGGGGGRRHLHLLW